MHDLEEIYTRIYDFVRTIPTGKVVTYGQVADCVTDVSVTARMVGAAMHTVPEGVPWQRVVGAGGTLPIHKRSPELAARQTALLQVEGVVFLAESPPRIAMAQSQWQTVFSKNSQDSLFASNEETPIQIPPNI